MSYAPSKTPEAGEKSGDFSASSTKHASIDSATIGDAEAFNHLQQAFADAGHRLTRSEVEDFFGTATLFPRGGWLLELPDIDAARRFLLRVGGKL